MTPDPTGTAEAPAYPGVPTYAGRERRRALRGTDDLDTASVVPEDVLVRQAVLGDKSAFAQLVTRHGPALYRYVLRLLHDAAEAEDCVQETVLAAWRALPGFRGESGVRTWLFVLGRREAQKRLHRDRPRFPASGSLATIDVAEVAGELRARHGDPESELVGTGLLSALDAALLTLPERQRSVWILREVEELSYTDIAAVVGISPAAVRGLLQRARSTIATTLEEWR